VFKRSLLRLGVVRGKYDGQKVSEALEGVLGRRKLGDAGYRTGLLVVAKRLDSGSPWLLGNNPKMPYMQRGEQATTIANGEYPLSQVVRASTAAPHYFDPERVQIGRAAGNVKAVLGEFFDGGVSPSNNPSLQALMAATIPRCGFGWNTGADELLVCSVGTGRRDPALGLSNLVTGTAAINAVLSLAALMEDCSDQVEALMQWLSVSPTARRIDRLVGKVEPPLGGRAMLSYLRYNVLMTPQWCRDELGVEISADDLQAMAAMDDPDQLIPLDGLGRTAGAVLVEPGHFAPGFDAGVRLG
jgi:hypothetical protein